jgi:hypothetical protein
MCARPIVSALPRAEGVKLIDALGITLLPRAECVRLRSRARVRRRVWCACASASECVPPRFRMRGCISVCARAWREGGRLTRTCHAATSASSEGGVSVASCSTTARQSTCRLPLSSAPGQASPPAAYHLVRLTGPPARLGQAWAWAGQRPGASAPGREPEPETARRSGSPAARWSPVRWQRPHRVQTQASP